jgi:hypothetical protein
MAALYVNVNEKDCTGIEIVIPSAWRPAVPGGGISMLRAIGDGSRK